MRDRRSLFFRVAVPLALLAVPAWAGEPPGADSPQALVERLRAAITRGDTATARAGDGELDFVRVDGRWYELRPPAAGSGTH